MAYRIRKTRYGTPFHDWAVMEGNVYGKKLMTEWDKDKNIFELRITSYRVTFSTLKEVYWICSKCGRGFKASVCSRVHNHKGCPHCKKKGGTSIPEQTLFEVFKVLYPGAINRDRHLGFEIDIFIPELNLGIEYNGSYYHKILNDKSLRDRLKAEICREQGIKLIQVWDDGCSETPYMEGDGLTIKLKYRQSRVFEQMAEVSNLIINNVISGKKSSEEQLLNSFDSDTTIQTA